MGIRPNADTDPSYTPPPNALDQAQEYIDSLSNTGEIVGEELGATRAEAQSANTAAVETAEEASQLRTDVDALTERVEALEQRYYMTGSGGATGGAWITLSPTPPGWSSYRYPPPGVWRFEVVAPDATYLRMRIRHSSQPTRIVEASDPAHLLHIEDMSGGKYFILDATPEDTPVALVVTRVA